MQTALEKVRVGLSNPRLIVPYVERRAKLVRALLVRSEYGLAARYLSDVVTGGDRLRTYLESNDDERYLDCDVLDLRLRVDLLDEGISRDLLVDGVREPLATRQYRAELDRLEAERGGLTVVDVGANIGYFALLYPAQARMDGSVIAIEPQPDNFSLLGENVLLNGFEHAVDCYRCAIGPETGSTTMQVSTHSNLGTVTEVANRSHYVDEIDVPMLSLDDLLRRNGVPYESVDVVRMDLQGYEYEVFRGMPELLRRGDVGLAFLEVHPWYLEENDQYDEFVSLLQEAGFELVFAADGRTAVLRDDKHTYSERDLEIDSLEGLRDVDFTVEVILRR